MRWARTDWRALPREANRPAWPNEVSRVERFRQRGGKRGRICNNESRPDESSGSCSSIGFVCMILLSKNLLHNTASARLSILDCVTCTPAEAAAAAATIWFAWFGATASAAVGAVAPVHYWTAGSMRELCGSLCSSSSCCVWRSGSRSSLARHSESLMKFTHYLLIGLQGPDIVYT